MRRLAGFLLLGLVCLAGRSAHAQFANKSLGLGVGYLKIDADASVSWGLPLTLEGSLYIENGFDLIVRVPLMLLTQTNGDQILSAGANLGVRYLFSEESFRPYAGAELAFLYIFRETDTKAMFGLGPVVGFDYFFSDTWSIGPRAFANFFFSLVRRIETRTTFGGQLSVSTYF